MMTSNLSLFFRLLSKLKQAGSLQHDHYHQKLSKRLKLETTGWSWRRSEPDLFLGDRLGILIV